MVRIADQITDLIGGTPLVRIRKMNSGKAEVLVKLESFNPGGSSKDRVAAAMIESAESSGALKPGALIIEPTSGNTGIGLALTAAVKGYPLILTMPDTMSIERRKLLQAYGAQIVLTPGAEGMEGAVRKAQELRDANPGAFIPQQFENPANPAIHSKTTAWEIWQDTEGQLDAFVAAVGAFAWRFDAVRSGVFGTFAAAGRGLKSAPGRFDAATGFSATCRRVASARCRQFFSVRCHRRIGDGLLPSPVPGGDLGLHRDIAG